MQTGIFHWPALRKQKVICRQQESAGCANTDLHQEQRGEAASYSTINVSLQAISWQLDTLQLQIHELNKLFQSHSFSDEISKANEELNYKIHTL